MRGIVVLILCFCVSALFGQSRIVWKGTENYNFHEAKNWSPQKVPGPLDTAYINLSQANDSIIASQEIRVKYIDILNGFLSLSDSIVAEERINLKNLNIAGPLKARAYQIFLGAPSNPVTVRETCGIRVTSTTISTVDFKKEVSIIKQGTVNDFCQGNNVFRKGFDLRLSGGGNFSMAGNFSDQYLGPVRLHVSDSSGIQFSFKGSDNLFADSLIVNKLNGSLKFGQSNGLCTFTANAPIIIKPNAFEEGNLWFKAVNYESKQALSIHPVDTALVQFDNCIWKGELDIVCYSAKFIQSTFNENVSWLKTGNSNDVSKGGNRFAKKSSFTATDQGFILMGNEFPDTFEGPLHANSKGSGIVFIAHKALSNQILDSLVVSNTGDGGVKLGFANGSCSFSSQSTLKIGRDGFFGGKFSLRNCDIASGEAIKLQMADSSTLHFELGNTIARPLHLLSDNIKLDSSRFMEPVYIEKTGETSDSWYGGSVFEDSLSIWLKNRGSLFTANNLEEYFLGPIAIRIDSIATINFAHKTPNSEFHERIFAELHGKSALRFGQNKGHAIFKSATQISFKNDSIGNASILLDSIAVEVPMAFTGIGSNGLLELKNCVFNEDVSIEFPKISLAKNGFEKTLDLHKTGVGFDNSDGGNSFGLASFTNSNTGSMVFANKFPDRFNKTARFKNSNTGAINLWHKSSGTSILDTLVFEAALGSISTGLQKGSAQLSSGTIIIVSDTSTRGNIDINQIYEIGDKPMNLVLNGHGILKIDSSEFNNDLLLEATNLFVEKSSFYGKSTIKKTGGNNNIGAGGNLFDGPLSIINLSKQTYGSESGLSSTFNDSVSLYNLGGGTISLSYRGDSTLYAGPVMLLSDSGEIRFGSEGGKSRFLGPLSSENDSFKNSKLYLLGISYLENDTLSLELNPLSSIVLGPNSSFDPVVNISSGGINLEGSRFNQDCYLTKTGTQNDAGKNRNYFYKDLYASCTSKAALQLSYRDSGDYFAQNIYLASDSGAIKFGSAGGRTFFNEGQQVLSEDTKPFSGSVNFAECTFGIGSEINIHTDSNAVIVLGPNAVFKDTLAISSGSIGISNSLFEKPVYLDNYGPKYYSSPGNSTFLDSSVFSHNGTNGWNFQSNLYRAPVYFNVKRDSSSLFAGIVTAESKVYFHDKENGRQSIFSEGVIFIGSQEPALINLSDTIQSIRSLELNIGAPSVILDGKFRVEKFLSLKNGTLKFNRFPLRLSSEANSNGGNINSFVEGTLIKEGGINFSLPLGVDSVFAPIGFFKNIDDNTVLEVSYVANSFLEDFTATTLDSRIDFLSRCGYWVISNPSRKLVAPILFTPRDSACFPLAPQELSPIAFTQGSFYPLPNTLQNPNTQFYISEADTALSNNFILLYGSADNFRPFLFPLSKFVVSKNGNLANIRFATTFEKDNRLYELQRSYNNGEFIPMDSLPAGPFPNQEQEYLFTDTLGTNGVYKYRIRQESNFGVSSYTNIRVINLNGESDFQVYPQPFTIDGMRLEVLNNEVGKINIELYDLYGKLYYRGTFEKGENPLAVDLFRGNAFKTGLYLLYVESPTQREGIKIMRH